MTKRVFLSTIGFLLALAAPVRAAGPGDEVAIVYNASVKESKAVAEHYAKLRQVPASQILGLEMTGNESMTREQFTRDLQKPLQKWLEKEKLFVLKLDRIPPTNGLPGKSFWHVTEAKIRYLVLCYGVPLKISHDPELRESAAEKVPETIRRNGAAVDSELSLQPSADLKLPLVGPNKNPFYGITNAADFTPQNGILLVARLDGPTPEIAMGLVDKAITAEQTGLWGRAYIDARGLTNGEYKVGDDWMLQSAEIVRRKGFETILDTNAETFSAGFPLSQVGIYCGWYDGSASGPFAQPTVEFLPGAFAYHLHSYSAVTLRSPTQGWCGPLLAKGATITMGCVDEPYLAMTPNVALFLHRLLYAGFTFGEAAYVSQSALSWQTAVIGDPLYRPNRKAPPLLHAELEAAKSPLLAWSHLAVVNLNLAQGYPVQESIDYLTNNAAQSAVLNEKLGDLYEQAGKTWPAIAAWTDTLNYAPSPQQEIRLYLKLAAKLETEGKNAEALGTDKMLLKKFPDYPGKTALLTRMVALARKLNLPTEADQYQRALTPAPAKP